jgi:hypothetical protein
LIIENWILDNRKIELSIETPRRRESQLNRNAPTVPARDNAICRIALRAAIALSGAFSCDRKMDLDKLKTGILIVEKSKYLADRTDRDTNTR